MRRVATLILLSLLFALVPTENPTGYTKDKQANIEIRSNDDFILLWDTQRDVARYAFPLGRIFVSVRNNENLYSDALKIISEHPDIFGVSAGELIPFKPVRRMGKIWLNFRQYHLQIPVVDGTIYFRVSEKDNRVWAMGSKAITRFSTSIPHPLLSTQDAVRYASNFIPDALPQLLGEPELVWFPVNGVGILAWQLEIAGKSPHRFQAWVDAVTGEVLAWQNLLRFADLYGNVGIWYLPRYFDDPFSLGEFEYGRVSFNYVQPAITDSTGYYEYETAWPGWGVTRPFRSWLLGLWVEVIRMDGPSAVFLRYIAPPCELSWVWDTTLAEPDELNLYYHTNYIHTYYKRLDDGMTGLDYPVPARARVSDLPDNAYWDGYATNYGIPVEDRNFALFADIIYHEYTHGVSSWMYRDGYFPYVGESGALNEAFSDYFACTNTNDPRAGHRAVTDAEYIRNLDNNAHYPENIYGEPHWDSPIISGAFWDIRKFMYPHRVGRADTIVHFTRYSLANTFNDFALECFFTADDDGDINNGCPDLPAIANSFARHGVGPGFFPTILAEIDTILDETGDGFLSPDETADINITLSYPAILFYPDAESIFVTITCDDNSFSSVETTFVNRIERDSSKLASVGVGVADDISPHYAECKVLVWALSSSHICTTSVTIPIGNPQVAIVYHSDDVGLLNYYTNALKQIPVIYGTILADDDSPSETELLLYPSVLWFTGNSSNCISEFHRQAIGEYLEHGGAVILSGQNGFDSGEYSAWLSEYFGATVLQDSVRGMWVNGVAGDELGDGFNLMIFGASGANNQRSPSTLQPTDGTPFLTYQMTGNPVAGVRKQTDTFRSILLGFGLEAVVYSGNRISLTDALHRALSWLGVEISGVEQQCLSRMEFIRPYPNPFNSSVNFHLPENSNLRIFDIHGRCIADKVNREDNSAGFTWTPDGNLPSGVYIYRITNAAGELSGKIIYVR